MHARRYLFKAERYHPEAGPALDLIGELYEIEDKAEEQASARCAKADVVVSAEGLGHVAGHPAGDMTKAPCW